MGGLFSIYEGIHKISVHEGLKNAAIALIVLLVSVIFETASLIGCLSQIKKLRYEGSLRNWIKTSRQSELLVVLGEDTAALLGLTFAMISVLLATITGNPIFDALGSIAIGILLIVISLVLAVKVKNLLIGQSTDDETSTKIKALLAARPEVEEIFNLITVQLGPRIMVAVKAKMAKVETVDELIENINRCESALKSLNPSIQWVFFEPDVTN